MKKLADNVQRIWDLVRYARAGLHNAGLITNDEYSQLAEDHKAVARLETYDEMRAKLRTATTAEGYKPEFEEAYLRGDGPVHGFFGLSYAEYLTIPRSVLQSMPVEWQTRFVACLEQLDDTFDWRPKSGTCYRCDLYEMIDTSGDPDAEESWKWGRKLYDKLGKYRRQIFDDKKVR